MTRINQFRRLTEDKLCRPWSNHIELLKGVMLSLGKAINDHPRQGWQRFEDKIELLEALNTLKKENSDLKNKLDTKTSKFKNIINLDDEITVKCIVQKASYMLDNSILIKTTLSNIIRDTGYGILKPTLETTFKKTLIGSLQKFAHESRQILSVEQDSYEEVILTLKAYNIIAKAYQKGFEIIQLTPIGEEFLMSNKILKSSLIKEKV